MHIAAAPNVTLMIGAALGLLYVWLGLRVSLMRMQRKVMLGDGGSPALEARIRAHANLTEYAPIALILMLLIELHGGPSRLLWLLGALFVLGRVVHPLGLQRPAPNPYRAAGIFLTWGVIVALAIWAILIGYGVAR